MNKRYKLINIISSSVSLLGFGIVSYQNKYGDMPEDKFKYLGAITFVPIFSFLVFYSIKTGETFAGGLEVRKTEYPKSYYILTVLWCILFIIDIIYIFVRTFFNCNALGLVGEYDAARKTKILTRH